MDNDQRPKRGLSALLSSTTQSPGQTVLASSVATADVGLDMIRPSATQPRTTFNLDALNELAASIRARGLIQPLVVRALRPEEISGPVRYELIAGERRWRAARLAELRSVPVVIKPIFDEREILLVSLVENLQRDDLNPMEEALAYQRLAAQFRLTQDQIADAVGKNRASVSNTVRMLELPQTIQEAIKERRLSIGHAKVLLTIPDPKIQSMFSAKVQAEGLTIRALERLIATGENTRPGTPVKRDAKPRLVDAELKEIERRLREHFGTKVNVDQGSRKGRITIQFYSDEDLERVLKICGITASF